MKRLVLGFALATALTGTANVYAADLANKADNTEYTSGKDSKKMQADLDLLKKQEKAKKKQLKAAKKEEQAKRKQEKAMQKAEKARKKAQKERLKVQKAIKQAEKTAKKAEKAANKAEISSQKLMERKVPTKKKQRLLKSCKKATASSLRKINR